MPFIQVRVNVCTHSILGRTRHGTNLAGATHTQTCQEQVRGWREMVMSTRSIYKISFKLKYFYYNGEGGGGLHEAP